MIKIILMDQDFNISRLYCKWVKKLSYTAKELNRWSRSNIYLEICFSDTRTIQGNKISNGVNILFSS